MRQHVAKSDVVVQLVVVKLDRRYRVAHWIVPSQLSLLDEHAGGNRGKELGVRGNLAERGGGEGQLFLVVAIAVALGEDELVVDHDSDANTRRVPVFQYLLHISVEAFELFGDVGFLGANRECGEHQRECQCEQLKRASRSKETRMAGEIHGACSFYT